MQVVCHTHRSQLVNHPLTRQHSQSPCVGCNLCHVLALKEDNQPRAILCSHIFDTPHLRYLFVHAVLAVQSAGLLVYPPATQLVWLTLGMRHCIWQAGIPQVYLTNIASSDGIIKISPTSFPLLGLLLTAIYERNYTNVAR